MIFLIISCTSLLIGSSVLYGQGQILRNTLMHNGVERDYILYVPSIYSPDTSIPLVLNLHGFRSNGAAQMTVSQMNVVAEREGFLVTYPSAIAGDW